MGRTFLTCLPQFHLEESSCDFTVNDASASLASLEYDIQNLQKAISRDSLTLQWCTEALILLKKMHSEFLLVFQSLKVSMSWNGVSKFLDEYMNESVHILELCNLLKSATSEMNRYCLKIDITIKSKYFDEYLAEIQKLEREEKLQNKIKGRNLDIFKAIPSNKCKNSPANYICAIRGAMSIISSILFSVILYPIPVKLEKEIYCEFPQMKSFVNSVQDLARCFNEKFEIAGGKLLLTFVEYELIEKAIRDAKTQLRKQAIEDQERLERSKVSMQQKSAALKVGLEVFESEITRVFEEVLKGRNKLLRQITTSRTT